MYWSLFCLQLLLNFNIFLNVLFLCQLNLSSFFNSLLHFHLFSKQVFLSKAVLPTAIRGIMKELTKRTKVIDLLCLTWTYLPSVWLCKKSSYSLNTLWHNEGDSKYLRWIQCSYFNTENSWYLCNSYTLIITISLSASPCTAISSISLPTLLLLATIDILCIATIYIHACYTLQ